MTPRQAILLKAIIDEFIETAQAVGSLDLPKKYNIKASPATVRNEMADLVKQGYLKQQHSSAGRIPTTVGLKYYLHDLLEDLDEVEYQYAAEIRENLYQDRFNKKELILKALNYLSEVTNNAALALIEDNLFYSGLSNVLDSPEFQDLEKLRSLLKVIENYSVLYDLFRLNAEGQNIKILISEETGISGFENCAIIFTEIKLYQNISGYLSIIGPNRMKFSVAIPALKLVANTIEDIVKGW
jgi:transcriptional regulator of heat shock response